MSFLNILVSGVGGQGILTFTRVLSEACIKRGVNVVTAETHGMSQRGGIVHVHIRIGDIYSPLIPRGSADTIVSFELIEAIRCIEYANRETILLISDRLIRPPIPNVKIPNKSELIEYLKSLKLKSYIVPAYEMALKAGSSLSLNIVMLGVLIGSKTLDGYVNAESVRSILRGFRMSDINLRAFNLGYEWAVRNVNVKGY